MIYRIYVICGKVKSIVYEGEDINAGIHEEMEFACAHRDTFSYSSWYCKDTKITVRKNTWVVMPWSGLTKKELEEEILLEDY